MYVMQSLAGGTEPQGAGANAATASVWIELRKFEALRRKL
jgi:hypothetical protein